MSTIEDIPITAVTKLTLEPGDTLVVKVPSAAAESAVKMLRDLFPDGQRVLVIGDNMDITVVEGLAARDANRAAN